MKGFYYLHTNGDMIFKRFRPEDDSSFVKRIWPFNSEERESAWIIAIEGLALGANLQRIKELQKMWGFTDEDGKIFAERVNLRVFKDGDSWCATFDDFINFQESQAGFGNDVLEALADLARPGLKRK